MIHTPNTQYGGVDEVGLICSGNYKHAVFAAIVELAKQFIYFARHIGIVMVGTSGSHRLKLIETQHRRSFGTRLIKQIANKSLCTVYIDARQIRCFYKLIIESRLLRKTLRNEGFATAGRSIKQHSVGYVKIVTLGTLLIPKYIKDTLVEEFFEVFHTGYIGKAIAFGFCILLSSSAFRGFCNLNRPQHRFHHLVGTTKTIAVQRFGNHTQ